MLSGPADLLLMVAGALSHLSPSSELRNLDGMVGLDAMGSTVDLGECFLFSACAVELLCILQNPAPIVYLWK